MMLLYRSRKWNDGCWIISLYSGLTLLSKRQLACSGVLFLFGSPESCLCGCPLRRCPRLSLMCTSCILRYPGPLTYFTFLATHWPKEWSQLNAESMCKACGGEGRMGAISVNCICHKQWANDLKKEGRGLDSPRSWFLYPRFLLSQRLPTFLLILIFVAFWDKVALV